MAEMASNTPADHHMAIHELIGAPCLRNLRVFQTGEKFEDDRAGNSCFSTRRVWRRWDSSADRVGLDEAPEDARSVPRLRDRCRGPDTKNLELLELTENQLTLEGVRILQQTGVVLRWENQAEVGSTAYLGEGDFE
jgi:hypothetical protein